MASRKTAPVLLLVAFVIGLGWYRLGSMAEPVVPVRGGGHTNAPVAVARALDAEAGSPQRLPTTSAEGWHWRILLTEGDGVSPAAGASLLYRPPGPREQHVLVRADEAGLVRTPLLEAPPEAMVWHRYGARRVVRHDQGATTPESTIVLAAAGAILVRAPAARAGFVARIEPTDENVPRGDWTVIETASEGGIAVCEGVPAAWKEVRVGVLAGGNPLGTAIVGVVARTDVDVLIQPVSPCEIRGSAVDVDGAPLGQVFVSLVPEDDIRTTGRSRYTETAADGSFVLPAVDATHMRLVLSKPGHGAYRSSLDCTAGGDLDLGRIVVPAGRRVRGRVTHPDSASSGGINGLFPKLRVGHVAVDDATACLSVAPSVAAVRHRVDAEGAFELRGLGSGTHLIFAAETGVGGSWTGALVRIMDADVEGVALDLPRRRAWRCELRGADGGKPPDCEVLATNLFATWFARATANPDGRAELMVGEGPFVVGVRIGVAQRWLHLATGQTESESLPLPDGQLTIEGLDCSSAGDLLMSELRLTYLEGQLPGECLPLTMPCGPLAPDAAGRIVLPHLLPGRYRLLLRAPNWGRRELTFDLLPREHATRVWTVTPR